MTEARVLVVEDNPLTRKLLRLALEQAGFAVLEAADGRAALTEVSHPLDLVLLDMTLPDIHGMELAPQLRALLPEHAPIVALTGHLGTDDPHVLAHAGFSGVVHKPIEPSRLIPLLRKYLQDPSLADEHPYRGRHVLLVGDEDAQLRRQTLRLKQAGFEVTTARNGVEALLKLREAVPDAVLSDVLMPEVDGFDLCLAIREDPSFRDIPVVLMSPEYVEDENHQLALKVGADALVVRTLDIKQALTALTEAFERRSVPTVTNDPPTHAEHFRRVAQRLEHHVATSMQLTRGQALATVLRAFLHQLADLQGASADAQILMERVLEGCLDASGCPAGAAYRLEADGKITLSTHLGASSIARDHWAEFFGHLELLHEVIGRGEPIAIPSAPISPVRSQEILARARMGAMLITPLRLGAERFGALVLAAPGAIMGDEEWVAIARSVMTPIGQTTAPAQSYSLLQAANEKARLITDSMREGVLVTDQSGRIAYANASIERLTGHPAHTLMRQSVHAIYSFIENRAGTHVVELTHAAGQRVAIEVSTSVLEERSGQLSYAHVLRDVGGQTRVEQLVRLARHDPLTDLYNRRHFEEEVAVRLNESKRYQVVGALLMFDLDHSEPIDDRLAHAAGDSALKAFAAFIDANIRQTDVAARLGGDEFAILSPYADGAQAQAFAAKLLERLQSVEAKYNGTRPPSHTSIGIALYGEHALTPDALMQCADQALYDAKQAGRGCIRLYQAPPEDARVSNR